jgi:hypothetical protein
MGRHARAVVLWLGGSVAAGIFDACLIPAGPGRDLAGVAWGILLGLTIVATLEAR